jgi:hypothetical protein
MRSTRNLFALFLPALFCSATLWGQAAGSGAITGKIRDPYGDGIPDVNLVLTNDALGLVRTLSTSDDGVFTTPALIPAAGYSLKATRKGFAPWETHDIRVSVGQTVRLYVLLQVQKEGVKTETTSMTLDTGEYRVGVSELVDQTNFEGLPNSQRQWPAASLLAPMAGVNPLTGQTAFHAQTATTQLIDGIDVTNRLYTAAPSRQAGMDAAQEFQVMPAGATGEFSGAIGGTLNAITRSGANTLHGALYEYYRKPTLNAADPFSLGTKLPQSQRQTGASVGGSMGGGFFFFANGEVFQNHTTFLNRITNPLIANADGTAVAASNCAATAAQCAAAANFIQSRMNVVGARDAHAVNGFFRLDYRASERDALSFEVNNVNWHANHGALARTVATDGSLLSNSSNATEQSRFAKLSWIANYGSTVTNEIRAGFYHDRWNESPDKTYWPSTGALGVNIAGTSIAGSPLYPRLRSEQRYQAADNFSFNYFAHTVRFGVNFSKTADRINQLQTMGGVYNYATLTGFAQDFTANTASKKSYMTFNQAFGEPVRHWPMNEWDFYAQDTWRPTARLTVDMGLRWEKQFLPQPRWVNTDYYATGTISGPSIDFSPRIGLAYQISDRTVARFGYGFFYSPFTGEFLDSMMQGGQSRLAVNYNGTGAPLFPNVVLSANRIPYGSENVTYPVGKLRNPFTKQMTFSLERGLGFGTTFTATYVVSPSIKDFSVRDQNLQGPTKNVTYTIADASGSAAGTFPTEMWTAKNDSAYAHLFEIGNLSKSWYNGLVGQLRKDMSHGLSLQASITWSHAIDTAGANIPLGQGLPYSYSEHPELDKGSSNWDQRRRGTIAWVWQPKFVDSNNVFARFLANGWQVSGMATFATGLPTTSTVILSGQQFAKITPLYATSLNGGGGWDRLPFMAINTLRAPTWSNLDARVTRTLPFTERVKGLLMFEAFNALNSKQITGVNSIGYLGVAGVLTPVAGVGAGNSSSAYPDGTTARRCQIAFRLEF